MPAPNASAGTDAIATDIADPDNQNGTDAAENGGDRDSNEDAPGSEVGESAEVEEARMARIRQKIADDGAGRSAAAKKGAETRKANKAAKLAKAAKLTAQAKNSVDRATGKGSKGGKGKNGGKGGSSKG